MGEETQGVGGEEEEKWRQEGKDKRVEGQEMGEGKERMDGGCILVVIANMI